MFFAQFEAKSESMLKKSVTISYQFLANNMKRKDVFFSFLFAMVANFMPAGRSKIPHLWEWDPASVDYTNNFYRILHFIKPPPMERVQKTDKE